MKALNNLRQKALLLSLLLVAMGLAKAQNFLYREYEWDNLATENRIWVQMYASYYDDSTYYQFGIKGDTTFNGKSYKKLISCSHLGYPIEGQCVGGLCTNEGGKVYWVSFLNEDELKDIEVLLYDFSLPVCGRFYYESYSLYHWGSLGEDDLDYVFETDILDFNGTMRKVLWFDSHDCVVINDFKDEYWIEGIGCIEGLFHPLWVQPYNGAISRLVEVFQDGESIFKHPMYANIDYTGFEEQLPQNITLSPNPTTGIVRIDGEKATEIQVLNALGQLVKTVQNTNEVNLHGLPQGIYLMRVTLEGGKTFSDKVVKE